MTPERGADSHAEPEHGRDARATGIEKPGRDARAAAGEAVSLERIGLYGVGHFGYAMLRHLQRKTPGEISLISFDRDPDVRRSLRVSRRHPYHTPESTDTHAETRAAVKAEVTIADSVDELVADLDALVLAVTSDSTREVVANIAGGTWARPLTLINTAKALDFQTGRRLSDIVAESLAGTERSYTYAMLAGGTIASDLMLSEPLGMTIACADADALPALRRLFASRNLWVEATTDLAGVEYAGAFKNVVAICAGMVRGLGHSYGSVTHLISRLAREIEDFCVHRLGADRATFSAGSQCWGSDLWMSCTGKTRNQALGRLLGRGLSLDEANAAMAERHKTVEGVQTLRAIRVLVAEYEAELPLLTIAKRIILDGEPPRLLIEALMQVSLDH